MVLIHAVRLDPPLEPDAVEARRLVLDELARPEYRAAEPTAFDLAAQAVRDWIADLLSGAGGLPLPALWLVLVTIAVVLVVLGLLVFGLPRLRRRAGAAVPLFDDGDVRDAATLRSAADAAARAGDWPLAIEERFRALVRGLVERELVRVHPGTTAHGMAAAATVAFPDHAARLEAAAADFDAVRYLARAGSAAAHERIAQLDGELAASVPELEREFAEASPIGRPE
ncbi:uncharacterized protein YjeT (DUF2065 family) [Agromyces flavus]|uniref:Uncharacterized protein YjeT (DUF2065 family) n=1 Tax=Agromyces flavus TaxID=589382 RepID=A0A1H1UC32_9MICO|nr:DUF4129 domain-containing protein [Agromyces flavus]MCP2368246.1 uncharacterized protein YjeT (DUF2065 family) [Agromyces flavus]GGI47706.1 hypothetical protein GCM10010932_23940 [Agromyces flavus]SDS70072.1 protein of unknown function [Agromyces flavus]